MKNRSEKKPSDSLYVYAKNIINTFKETAHRMKTKPDVSANLWLGDAYQEKYQEAHTLKFTLAESGLAKEQFYAVSELIDKACSLERYQMEKSERDPEITFHCNQGSEQLVLTCEYNFRIAELHAFDIEKLAAPVSLLPLAGMQEKLNNMLAALSPATWEETSRETLTQEFSNLDARLEYLNLIKAIESSCKELDKAFDLKIDFKHHSTQTTKISVNKQALATAANLLCGPILCAEKKCSPLTTSKATLFSVKPESVKRNLPEMKMPCLGGAPGGPKFI